jgi:hypothetical protein
MATRKPQLKVAFKHYPDLKLRAAFKAQQLRLKAQPKPSLLSLLRPLLDRLLRRR